jgi:glutamine synthetase type III
VEVGACNESEINARCECAKDNYILTVEAEAKALVHTATQSVVPRAYAYFNTLSSKSEFASINRFSSKFGQCLDETLAALQELEERIDSCKTLKEASKLREKVGECGLKVGKLCGLL